MTEPGVTIGIATRNRCDLLRKAIGSALAQSWPTKAVVVVDDASTDGTSELVEEFPSVRWVRNAVPEGHMANRNRLMLQSPGAYFCSLDDDAWFLGTDEIERSVRTMEQNPEIAALAFDILDPKRPDPIQRMSVRPVDTFIGCGHMLRVSATRAVGGYAPLPGLYGGEEKDLCLRLFDRGWDVGLLPGVHVWHERTPVERDSFEQHASGVCNDLAIAGMRFPLSTVCWRLPAKILSHMRFALAHGLTPACLVGIGRFFCLLPKVLAQREPVSGAALRTALDPVRRGRHGR